MDPPLVRIVALNTGTQYLADEPTLADGPPGECRMDALNTTTPNLADEPTLADGPPRQSRIDALNTTTSNLPDEPTLANGPPKRIENRCLEYHYTKLGRWTPHMQCIMGYILWDAFGSHFGFSQKRWEFPVISE